MVSRSLVDVASTLLEATRAGTITPGKPYTLNNLAQELGISPKSVKKLATIWQTLEQTGLKIEIYDNQKVGQGKRRYTITLTPRKTG
jgi:biotin operon repressor